MAKTEEYSLGEYTYPRGWFMVGLIEDLEEGKPLSLRFFGRELALYRGESGRLILLDAACPHMGTNIAKNTTSYTVLDGQIEGDSIRCPYHAWRFDADGQCDDIPYHDGPIPRSACMKSWTVEEKYGCVFAWHDPEGNEPDYSIPLLPEWEDESWVNWKIDRLGVLESHPQEVIDNITDAPHLGPIHGSTLGYYENEFRGHLAIQRQGGGHRTLTEGDAILETDTWYTGPGILMSRVKGLYNAVMYITHTPVDDGTTRVWHGLMVKTAHGGPATEEDVALAREYQESSRLAFAQDFEIWGNKEPCLQVLQITSDGPFHKARAWYKQFYNPSSMTEKLQSRANGVYTVNWLEGAPKEVSDASHYE